MLRGGGATSCTGAGADTGAGDERRVLLVGAGGDGGGGGMARLMAGGAFSSGGRSTVRVGGDV